MNESFWTNGIIEDAEGNRLVWPTISIRDTQHLTPLADRSNDIVECFQLEFALGESHFIGFLNIPRADSICNLTLNIGLSREEMENRFGSIFASEEEKDFYQELLQNALGGDREKYELSWGTVSLSQDGWTLEPYIWVDYRS